MAATLTVDHRAVDGLAAAKFLADLREFLEVTLALGVGFLHQSLRAPLPGVFRTHVVCKNTLAAKQGNVRHHAPAEKAVNYGLLIHSSFLK